MDYWRQKNFTGLSAMATEAGDLGYEEFAEYCRLREKGLRSNAFEALKRFIAKMDSAPPAERRKFTEWHQTHCHLHPEINEACPKPLKEKLIRPTVLKWIKETPDDPIALRWSDKPPLLLRAAQLNPADPIAVGRLAVSVLTWVDYTTHELPYGYLGDNAREDLSDVQNVINLLNGGASFTFSAAMLDKAFKLKTKLETYLASKK